MAKTQPPYDSPSQLATWMSERGLAMSKRFGQNFMISPAARNKVLEAGEPLEGTRTWEVGPGVGALTASLLEKTATLTAFEIDHGFITILHDLFDENACFKLVEGDVLKTWEPEWGLAEPERLVANLPYNIGTVFILKMLESGKIPRIQALTLQKELAERLSARPDSEAYGGPSVLAQTYCTVSIVANLSSQSFWPAPKVASSVLRLERRPDVLASPGLARLVRCCFSSRRKTILNNLKQSYSGNALDARLACARALSIEPSARAETLSPETFKAWADAIGTI